MCNDSCSTTCQCKDVTALERIARMEKELAELKKQHLTPEWQNPIFTPKVNERFYVIGQDFSKGEFKVQVATNSNGAVKNVFRSKENAQEFADAFNTMFKVKGSEGVVKNVHGKPQPQVSLSVYGEVKVSALTGYNVGGASFKDSYSAQKALNNVGSAAYLKVIKTLSLAE